MSFAARIGPIAAARATDVPIPPPDLEALLDAMDTPPTRHYRLGDAGSTMVARLGGLNGTWHNSPRTIAGSLVQNGAGPCTELNALDENPTYGTILTPITTAAFTVAFFAQFDSVKGKHVLTTMPANEAGGWSAEVMEDGAGGLKPRMYSRTGAASAGAVIYEGTNTGTVPVGDGIWLTYRRNSDGSQTFLVDGVEIGMTLVNGTPPASWSVPPAGDVYLGAFGTQTAFPLQGLIQDLVIWDYAVATSDLLSLALARNVVTLEHIDAGNIFVDAVATVDLADAAHPKEGITPAVVTAPTLSGVTFDEAGEDIEITVPAGTVEDADFGEVTISRGGVTSDPARIDFQVVAQDGGGGGEAADLPFMGLYYGGIFGGHNAANTKAQTGTELGESFFFIAPRTATPNRIFWHWRVQTPSYAAGTGGTYTIEIRSANASTRLPHTGVSPICQANNIPGGPVSSTQGSAHYLIYNFTTIGQLTAGQPYALVWRNTHSNPGSNYVSTNISNHITFADATDPANYDEPSGINPESVGSSPAAVRGWNPVSTNGQLWYPWPSKATNGTLRYSRMGPMFAALGYSDGEWTGFGGGWGGNHNTTVYRPAISGSNRARVRFHVTRATRVVSGVYVRAFRVNTNAGNLVVRLESGGSDTASGTLVEEVSVNSTLLYNAGASEIYNEIQQGSALDFIHWVWVPFTQNRTLTEGQFYNLVLYASGSASMAIRGSSRSDALPSLGPSGRTLTWNQWDGGAPGLGAAQRRIEMEAWEDSRVGCEVSTNGGSSWSTHTARLLPVLFKCVT